MDASAAAFDGVLLIEEVEFSRVGLVVLSDSCVTALLVLVDVIPWVVVGDDVEIDVDLVVIADSVPISVWLSHISW